ncbi:ASPIC/UnbV domain-containing protein [Rathayibacter iranicus]|uniref:ASPIC/UnbV domain-containing protein n=1 Tax=Rathayibacter iranicus TaxID=59737 RepID=UPI003B967770
MGECRRGRRPGQPRPQPGRRHRRRGRRRRSGRGGCQAVRPLDFPPQRVPELRVGPEPARRARARLGRRQCPRGAAGRRGRHPRLPGGRRRRLGPGSRPQQIDGGNGHASVRAPQAHFGQGDADGDTEVTLSWRDRDGSRQTGTITLPPGSWTLVLGSETGR